jgi:K+-sensing histidine kinase KdpD
VARQQLKRLRHTLLRQPTLDHLLQEVFLFLRDTFEKDGQPLDLFYLDVVPGRALQVHTAAGNGHPLIAAWQTGGQKALLPLVSPSGNLVQVLEWKRRVLATDARALVNQTFTGAAAMQLLVPVLVVDHPDQSTHRIAGILALECSEALLDDSDLELFENIAALLADYIATRAWQRRTADQEREEEQKNLLDGIACRLCGPLQQAQSSLELLSLHLQRGQAPDAEQLRQGVAGALEAMERASLATENIRLFQPLPSLVRGEYDLARLVRQTLRRCQANLHAAGVEVDESGLATAGPVLCRLDVDHLSYALEALLRNVWETALREPAGRTGSPSRRWRLALSLDLDPLEQRSARLGLHDNGPGFSDDVLARFAEGRFIPSQKRSNGMRRKGLGLVEARRLLEMLDGQLELRNAAVDGGAVVLLFLPLSETPIPTVVTPVAGD